mmetsp:Transcript_30982/g.70911  ORF Transcript_30982/g.70911 Transcript_30982/m.70911 type:complete len:210 (-) Transcript_30982:101-730(-)
MGCSGSIVHGPVESLQKELMRANSRVVTVHITKVEGVPLGLAFMSRCGGVLITSVGVDGCLQEWNEAHPGDEVLPGDMILSVNGVADEFWAIAAEVWKTGEVVMEVQKASSMCSIRRSGSRMYLERDGVKSKAPLHGPVDHLPHICAGESSCNASECAICLEDFDDETRVVELPCKHVFHPLCAARWLARGTAQCPLCRSAGHMDVHRA